MAVVRLQRVSSMATKICIPMYTYNQRHYQHKLERKCERSTLLYGMKNALYCMCMCSGFAKYGFSQTRTYAHTHAYTHTHNISSELLSQLHPVVVNSTHLLAANMRTDRLRAKISPIFHEKCVHIVQHSAAVSLFM